MKHQLTAAIGHQDSIGEFASRWVSATAINLPQNFIMVPLTAVLCDDIWELVNIPEPDPFPECDRLSARIEFVLRDASQSGTIGYIETNYQHIDYFGVSGTQSAIAWHQGKISIGPLKTTIAWNGEAYQEMPIGKKAIDRVLSSLGVWTHPQQDEFDMLGLARFKDTESAQKWY